MLLNAWFAAGPPSVAEFLANAGRHGGRGATGGGGAGEARPEALAQVAGRVTPPSAEDAKARAALQNVAAVVSRPGAERERAMVARVLLRALETATHPQVKTFLVNLLQLTGKGEAVAPLAKLLRDPDLCEPAAQALVAFGGRGVVPALRRALADLSGPGRVTILRALGDLAPAPPSSRSSPSPPARMLTPPRGPLRAGEHR